LKELQIQKDSLFYSNLIKEMLKNIYF